MSSNFFEDYFNAYKNTSKYKDTCMLDIALRKKEFEQNLDEMWAIYRKGNTKQIVEYQKGLDQIKQAGYKVYRNSKGKHKIVMQQTRQHMSRVFDMCDVCKLDEENICDYNCIKERENRICRFHTCPNFIYDDKNPITNAEMFSTKLKDDDEIDSCVRRIYDEFLNAEDLIEWLRDNAEFVESDE